MPSDHIRMRNWQPCYGPGYAAAAADDCYDCYDMKCIRFYAFICAEHMSVAVSPTIWMATSTGCCSKNRINNMNCLGI